MTRQRLGLGEPVTSDAGPGIEECNAALRSRAGLFRLVCANRSQVTVARLGEAAQNPIPMLLASAPAKDRAVCGIRDGVDDAGAADPRALAMRSAEIRRSAPGRKEPSRRSRN